MLFTSEIFNRNYVKAALLSLPLLAAGCSFSDSSRSFSDSSGSISDSVGSISESSGSSQSKKYENEVSDYTQAYVKSKHAEADYTSFVKGLSDIAAKRGVVNWEEDNKTYIAIGKGLKKAGVEGTAYETYKKNFAESDQEHMKDIQKGYDSEK